MKRNAMPASRSPAMGVKVWGMQGGLKGRLWKPLSDGSVAVIYDGEHIIVLDAGTFTMKPPAQQ